MFKRLLQLGGDEAGVTLLEFAVFVAVLLVIMLVKWAIVAGPRV